MINLDVIITALIGIMTSGATSWITWFLTKKKYNAEVDGALLDNMKESLNFYKELSEDNKRRLEDVLDRNKQLEKEVSDLRRQVTAMLSTICTDLTCIHRISKNLEY